MNHLEAYWTGEAEYDYPTIDDLLLGPGYRDVALDLGCGNGRYLVHLARQYQMVIGMDLPQSTLDVLQTYANVPANVYLLSADVRHLPLQSGSVTAVLAWGLLCELAVETIQHSLTEMARVLKPGGMLSIYEPINRFGYPEPENVFRGMDVTRVIKIARKVKDFYLQVQPLTDPLFGFDERDLVQLAEKAGFKEIHMELEARIGS